MMYPETRGWICALTKPSRVAIHSLTIGVSCCVTAVTCTTCGGGAAGLAPGLLHPPDTNKTAAKTTARSALRTNGLHDMEGHLDRGPAGSKPHVRIAITS